MTEQPGIEEYLRNMEVWWAIRLSSFDELDIELTKNMFQPYAYIISEEGDGVTTKYHQHILLVWDTDTETIRQLIKSVYPNCIGNKCLYIKPSRDKRQLAKYTLKEGKYFYKGFTKQFIDDTFKCAKAKTDLKKEVTTNEDDFILNRIDFPKFIERYIDIKVRHDQPLYINHIEAYCTKMKCKVEPRASRCLAMQICEKINH